jgi:hypothetical protein
MVILPLLGRPGAGGEGSAMLIASSLPAKPAKNDPLNPQRNGHATPRRQLTEKLAAVFA